MENLKEMVGVAAAKFVEDGMVVGLGTGSTVKYFVRALSQRVKAENLQLIGVTTSTQTTQLAESVGIKVVDIAEVDQIDLTVDGADEVDGELNGIKGGGGALLMEKIVASHTMKYVWIVDESKLVNQLGAFPLPVEVVQYGAANLFRDFAAQGYQPTWREQKGKRLITDQGHFIIDLHLKRIKAPEQLAQSLKQTVGVVEHGLFLYMAERVLVGTESGVKVLGK